MAAGIAYLSVLISPSYFWPAGFFALATPTLLVVNFLFLVLWLRKKKKYFWWPLVTLLIGLPFLRASFGWNLPGEKEGFSVLSYNVRVFNLYENDKSHDYTTSEALIKWVEEEDSDIKCFQEFYNNANKKQFATAKRLEVNGKYYSYVNPTVTNSKGGEFGLAIFSKFPIVNKGSITLRQNSTNSAIFADVLMETDTLRIYNIHLQSLNFREEGVLLNDDIKNTSKNVIRRMKIGFTTRTRQLDKLKEHIESSPHKVILCGDLNDTPYSYTYFQLRMLMGNAFEKAGTGLGFSYNGNRLFFLRIDNQFYTEGIKPSSFQTLEGQQNSDHFPIKAFYKLSQNP
ncbi:endonuclease/exonuclease/phosphatase family protein [Flammeovirgaceae bacterium SG7u.111]|nr:endonuclease/exonuclease/phosphatase family protein [Flammeovirgaceae bacterium SG7u.132]WPO34641.1 endonuclease/exonuclease/phosphatase family protein [Flammeovirgaceae bacterium SG7u.111]